MSYKLTPGVLGSRRRGKKGLLLDQYPTTGFAYSYSRELLTGQGKVVQARRQDLIPDELFSVQEISDGTLESFADGQSVRINRWESVQGNVYNILENTYTHLFGIQYPTIAISGNLIKVNNIPTLDLSDNNKELLSSETIEAFSENNFTWYQVSQTPSITSSAVAIAECELNTSFNGVFSFVNTNTDAVSDYRPQSTSHIIRNSANYPRPQQNIDILVIRRTGNVIEAFLNDNKMGETVVNDVFTNQTGLRFGARGSGQNSFRGRFFETIMYPESQSDTVMNDIIQNQMDYYL